MKLYYSPGSCSLAVHIILNELGLEFERVKVDHKSKTTDHGEDYFRLNPFGYVPLVEADDGFTLREGPAIMQYLADLHPESKLAPENGTRERYRLQEWLSFLTSEIHKGFIPLLYARVAGSYGTETATPKLQNRYVWINDHLRDREFLMEDYSVADAYLFALTQWGQAEWLLSTFKTAIVFDGFDNLRDWYLRMQARPAVQTALEVEGLIA